ncbi:LOW QUALITY PROTEIN: GEM-like protein 4 [Actinidia eriantha]|uniref:LOW QUALITY PROTEIN: GEM-like protein 4 n=1 Tax=Actinidia eriantha TaxID=165200 RepID=UPI00258F859C|nr:LOW QUALITY PROTEIN: GEM-like protein 4 [Actinidia eriantha]
MKDRLTEDAIGIPVSSIAYSVESTPKRLLQDHPASKHDQQTCRKTSQSDKKGIREHVRLGSKISKTVKGKLSLGAKILKASGIEKIFKRNFSVREGEKLFKTTQCYILTTAGTMTGLLFISTDKVAFCSERSIKFSSPSGEFIRVHYKVLIPVGKLLRANENQNVKRPSRKYIEIVVVDNYDFWFMGFLKYQKTLRYL